MGEWGGHRGTEQVVIVFAFLGLSLLVLSMRLFTRLLVLQNFGVEDWVILAAFCFSVPSAALVVLQVQHGQGLHDAELPAEDLLNLNKIIWQSIPCYLAGLYLTKLSILLQYKRLFREHGIYRIIMGMIFFILAYGTWSILGSIFFCTPVNKFWDPSVTKGHCMNRTAKWVSDALITIVTDLTLLILPMPYIKNLNLPKGERAGLMAVFALGGFVCLVSIARLKPLYDLATTHDEARYDGPASWLSNMEINVGIICASLPCLRAITLRAWSRTPSDPEIVIAEVVELEAGLEQRASGHILTHVDTAQTYSQRRESIRKMSVFSTNGTRRYSAWVSSSRRASALD